MRPFVTVATGAGGVPLGLGLESLISVGLRIEEDTSFGLGLKFVP